MKTALIALVMVLGLSSTAVAWPNAEQMRENFDICNSLDETWMNRFGQYLVSFDVGEAAEICNVDPALNGPAQVMACRFNSEWLYAGYYCAVPHK